MSKPIIQLFPNLFQPDIGSPIAAEWGQLTVPENRSAPDERVEGVDAFANMMVNTASFCSASAF